MLIQVITIKSVLSWCFRADYLRASGLAVLLWIVSPQAAWAIPSPELIVSSLSSVSQLWGMAGAIFGGGALAMGARRTAGAGNIVLHRYLWLLTGVAVGAVALDVVQFVNARNDRLGRLEAALLRPTPKRADGKSLDLALREIPYAAQIVSPDGLSTDATAALLAEIAAGTRPDVVALDVRETVEAEQGGLAGARPVRFPDLAASGIDFKGKSALLFCHNGNRSAETCAQLKAKGIDCRFMIGGFEKWLVEGRSLQGTRAQTLADLRNIAPYPHQMTLLDTAAVKALVTGEHAIFVDPRYPGEFETGHLPGAINLPMRSTPTVELAARLQALPPGPVIAPCYDRRSCFYGDVLGLELTRQGRDFRGRYTVPWEYFEASVPPPHVVAWLKEASVTPYGRAARALSHGLEQVASQIGLLGAIFALALAARLAVWPIAAKADRDQSIARVINPQMVELKRRLADDPVRLARAQRHLLARHGLTPARNLLALLFLPLLALSIEAVTQLATRHAGERFAPLSWIRDVGVPDPTYALPVAFGVLLAGYLHATLAQTVWQKGFIWGVAAPALVVLAAAMSAGANFYMVASAALLIAQRVVTAFDWRRVVSARKRLSLAWVRWRLGDGGLVALQDVVQASRCGNKAARLAVLSACGHRVPPGIVLTHRFLEAFQIATPRRRNRQLGAIWRHVGARRLQTSRVAVRSSGGAEDGAGQSFAGVFDTVLDVERAGLSAAILQIAASFHAARVGAYATETGDANILVQRMVSARFAGVVFTRDPGVPGCMLMEWVVGNGEALVSGLVTPQSLRIGRQSGEHEAGDGPFPFDVQALWRQALRIEARFGRPQDIEWAHDGREFVILQSRDIVPTPLSAQSAVADEWVRLSNYGGVSGLAMTATGPVLALDTMSELMPRPTPVSLSLLNAFWAGGGSMDVAARQLGFVAPHFDGDGPDARPLYTTAFGVLYADQAEKAARTLVANTRAVGRLQNGAAAFEADLRTRLLPEIVARAALDAALDLTRLDTGNLMALFQATQHRLVHDTHVTVDRVNIAAQVFMDEARKALVPYGADALGLLADGPETALRHGAIAILRLPETERGQALFALMAHRAPFDYELADSRFGETEVGLQQAAQQVAAAAGHRPIEPLHADALAALPKPVREAVQRAQTFVGLKEDAKHESLREVAFLRRILADIDRRFVLHGAIYFNTLDEVGTLSAETRDGVLERACSRCGVFDALKLQEPLPVTLTVRDLELGPLLTQGARANACKDGVVRALRVSGQGAVEGRAICVARDVCESGAPIPGFKAGDIIVARSLHPAWLPHVMEAGGVVVETGGWLSHMAILARERGLAMSVGAQGIDQITTGMRLRMELDGGVVTV